jgi:hypothetical protein
MHKSKSAIIDRTTHQIEMRIVTGKLGIKRMAKCGVDVKVAEYSLLWEESLLNIQLLSIRKVGRCWVK